MIEALDRKQAFLLYSVFCGDVVRTAHALGLKPVDVLRVADEEKWNEQLKPILELQKSTEPGALERGINRAVNFAQACQMRLFLERVLRRIVGMTDQDIEDYFKPVGTDKEGFPVKKLSTRALADLTTSLEKCHALSYLALSDTAQDRNRRQESAKGGEVSGSEMHAKIAAAMSKVQESTSPRALLFDQQLQAAQTANLVALNKASNGKPLEDDTYEPDPH